MICPSCKSDLQGEHIWSYFKGKTGSDEESDRIAEMYGANREKGHFGREIGIYDQGRDRTIAWRCPDCDHEWPR